MNFLSILFDRFWAIVGDIVLLNYYTGILKQKYVTKIADNNHFYHFDDFFQTIMEVLVTMLYIYLARCSTIESFYI